MAPERKDDALEYERILTEKVAEILPDYPEFLDKYKRKVTRLDSYRRKRMSITLAEPTVEALKWFADHLRDEDGDTIPLSYVIEDALTWIFRDPLVFLAFVSEMYASEEGEEDEGAGAEEEAKD